MNRLCVVLLLVALISMGGCESKSTPGGPGASKVPPTTQAPRGTDKNPIVGQAEETFKLSVPTLSTTVKQGESKTVTISIKRGKNLDEDVHLKFADVPKGVTIEPATIKHGETEAKINVQAAADAAVGDFTIKVTGHPTRGADASDEFKITVKK